MKNKKTFYTAGLTILAILVLGVVLARGFFFAPSDEVDLPASVEKSLTQGKNLVEKKSEDPLSPKRLRIHTIKVNAEVTHVGFTKKGKMATPRSFGDVGWFRYGTLPGDAGSAVIAGHLDNGFALPAVFNHLEDLKEGDDIYVDTFGGKTIHFVVEGSKTYEYKAPTEEIFNQKDEARLVLITCTGSWIPGERTHRERLVVTAIKSTD